MRQVGGDSPTSGNSAPFAYQDAAIVYTEPAFQEDEEADGTNTTEYKLNSLGQFESAKDDIGALTREVRDSNDLVRLRFDAEGDGATYTYDDRGNVISIRYLENLDPESFDPESFDPENFDPNAIVRQVFFEYDDEFSQLIEVKDERDNITKYELDANGNVERSIQGLDTPEELILTYDYYSTGQIKSVTDEKGRVTKYDYYQDTGLLQQITLNDDKTQLFTYDAAGNIRTFTDENLETTTYVYDALNRVERLIQPGVRVGNPGNEDSEFVNPETFYDYDAAGNLLFVSDPRGKVTEYVYDAYGRLDFTLDALQFGIDPGDQNKLGYTYDAADNLVETSDRRDNVTTYTYDARGRVTSIVDPLADEEGAIGVARYDYYLDNQLRSVTDRLGYTTTFEYDYRKRLLKETDARGKDTLYGYDSAGNLVSFVDRNGYETKYEYDALNRQFRITDATTAGIYEIIYSPEDGTISQTIDEENNSTSYTYDARTRLETVTNALNSDEYNGVTTYTYDGVGNLKTVKDGRGNTTKYFYDSLNRLTGIQDGEENLTQMGYDLAGNLIYFEDANGNVTTTEFDALNRPKRVIDALALNAAYDEPGKGIFEYEYDPNGNVKSTLDEENRETTYEYDTLNRLIIVRDAENRVTRTDYDQKQKSEAFPTFFSTVVTDPLGSTFTTTYDETYRQVENREDLGTANAEEVYVTTYKYVLNGFEDNENTVRQIVDSRDNTTKFEYDELYRLTQITDAEDGVTSYEYDRVGNLRFVTDPRANSTGSDDQAYRTEYIYDDLYRLKEVIDADNEKTTYEYDEADNLRFVTDRRANSLDESDIYKTEFKYDRANRLVERIDANDQSFVTEYDGVGNVVSETDELLRATTYGYDALNRLQTVSNPAIGNTTVPEPGELGATTYGYDAVGNLTSITDQLGRTTTYDYDGIDRQEFIKTELGFETRIDYEDDVENQQLIVKVTDGRANITKSRSDSRGRIQEFIDSQIGATANDGSDSVGDGVGTGSGIGAGTGASGGDDSSGSGVGSQNSITSYTYDGNDNLTQVEDELNRVTRYEYDSLNRQIGIISPLEDLNSEGHTITTQYDPNGNVVRIIDALDQTTKYRYDRLNRLKEVEEEAEDGLERITKYGYNEEGGLTSVEDPLENVTTYKYDKLNRLQSETAIDSDGTEIGTRAYKYDVVSNLKQITDRNGRVRRFDYDDLDRQEKEFWLEGEAVVREISYSYDPASQLKSAGDTAALYTFEYDDDGRLEFDTRNAQDGVPEVKLKYTYDEVNNRRSLTEFVGGEQLAVETYDYDERDRLTSITQNGNGVTAKKADITYDDANQLDLITVSTLGQTVFISDYDFDDNGRLDLLTHTLPVEVGPPQQLQYDYEYDAVDRLDFITGPQGTSDFSYDSLNQLEDADFSFQENESFDYDENGNRTDDAIGAYNRLENDGTYTYKYDNEGNRTRRTEIETGEITTYDWDYRNRLTEVTVRDASNTLLSKTNYEYDVFDRRIAKFVDLDGDGTLEVDERFVYDGDAIQFVFKPGGPIFEVDEKPTNGSLQLNGDGTYIYTPNEGFVGSDSFTYTRIGLDGTETAELVELEVVRSGEDITGDLAEGATRTGDELRIAQRYFYGPGIDQVIAEEEVGRGIDWALTNHQNSVEFVLNSDGEITNEIVYDSFGNVTSETDPSVDFRFGFTGRDRDEETGLGYYRARYYDPAVGRFLSEDPLGFDAGNANLYRYVGNAPTNFTDPSGLIADAVSQEDSFAEIGGALITFGAAARGAVGNLFSRTGSLINSARTTVVAGANAAGAGSAATLAGAATLAAGIGGYIGARAAGYSNEQLLNIATTTSLGELRQALGQSFQEAGEVLDIARTSPGLVVQAIRITAVEAFDATTTAVGSLFATGGSEVSVTPVSSTVTETAESISQTDSIRVSPTVVVEPRDAGDFILTSPLADPQLDSVIIDAPTFVPSTLGGFDLDAATGLIDSVIITPTGEDFFVPFFDISARAQAELSSIPGGRELVADILGTSGRSFSSENQLANKQVAALALQKLRSGNPNDRVAAVERPVRNNVREVTRIDVETLTEVIEIKQGLRNQRSLNPKKQAQLKALIAEATRIGKQAVYRFTGPINPELRRRIEKKGARVDEDPIDTSILDVL